MGRKPASGLVGLLLVGGLLTGCNKCCRQGFWGGQSVQDPTPTFGAVGDGRDPGKSWEQDPRRHIAVGDAMPSHARTPAATQVGRGGVGMPPAPAPSPYGQDIRPVGGESAGMGGIEQAGFESDPGRATPPAPAPAPGVNTEAHRPPYEGHDGMGAETNAGQPRKFRFPPAPVSTTSHEEVDEEEAGDFASLPPPPPPPPTPPGGEAEEGPQRAEPVGVPPGTIHSVPGGASDPGPVPPPFPPGN